MRLGPKRPRLTRRQLLASLGLAGAAVIATPAAAWARSGSGARLVTRATAAAGSDLGAVEHIVFLMMENRSYDRDGASMTIRLAPWACSCRTTPAGPR